MNKLPKGWKVIQGAKDQPKPEANFEKELKDFSKQVDSEIEEAMRQNTDHIMNKLYGKTIVVRKEFE